MSLFLNFLEYLKLNQKMLTIKIKSNTVNLSKITYPKSFSRY